MQSHNTKLTFDSFLVRGMMQRIYISSRRWTKCGRQCGPSAGSPPVGDTGRGRAVIETGETVVAIAGFRCKENSKGTLPLLAPMGYIVKVAHQNKHIVGQR